MKWVLPIPAAVTGTATATIGGAYTGTLSQGYHFTYQRRHGGGRSDNHRMDVGFRARPGTSPCRPAIGASTQCRRRSYPYAGNGTLKTNDTFGAGAFVPQVSRRKMRTLQVGNQIITSSTNQVSNAINGVTLSLSGIGGPSVVTVSPDITTEASQISAFVSAYNTALADTMNNTQACRGRPLRRWRTTADCG